MDKNKKEIQAGFYVFKFKIDLFCGVKISEQKSKLSFDNLENAFSGKSDEDINFSIFIFRLMSNPFLVKLLTRATLISLKLRLPVSAIIKSTIFRQFCGGETIGECESAINKLKEGNIKAILDYSVEGEQLEAHFEQTKNEIIRGIAYAKNNSNVPFSCVKFTGIARLGLLQKISEKKVLANDEKEELERVRTRVLELCNSARENNVPIYIDAEETWIQDAIDSLAEEMIMKYNVEKAYVFTTIQMYRWDRLDYFVRLIKKARENNFVIGMKIVRGAYLEKENERALELGYKTPMQSSKDNTDNDYDRAVDLAINNLDVVEVCIGTHNETSCLLGAGLMEKNDLPENHPRIYFSQLYGMSDHISYNLAALNYNVSKYLPYGPVKSTMPYLIRRAEENTAIAGQVGKELKLLLLEKKRRKLQRN